MQRVHLFLTSVDHDLGHAAHENVDIFARSMDHLQSRLQAATGLRAQFHIVTHTVPYHRLKTLEQIVEYQKAHRGARLVATPDALATVHPEREELRGGGDAAVDEAAERLKEALQVKDSPQFVTLKLSNVSNSEDKMKRAAFVDTVNALRDPFASDVLYDLWLPKPDIDFMFFSLQHLSHPLREFLTTKSPVLAARPEWVAVMNAFGKHAEEPSGERVAAVCAALVTLGRVTPSQSEWLVERSRAANDILIDEAILKLEHFSASSEDVSRMRASEIRRPARSVSLEAFVSSAERVYKMILKEEGGEEEVKAALADLSAVRVVGDDATEMFAGIRRATKRMIGAFGKLHFLDQAPKIFSIYQNNNGALAAWMIAFFVETKFERFQFPLNMLFAHLSFVSDAAFNSGVNADALALLWGTLRRLRSFEVSEDAMIVMARTFRHMRTACDFDGIGMLAYVVRDVAKLKPGAAWPEKLGAVPDDTWHTMTATLRLIGAIKPGISTTAELDAVAEALKPADATFIVEVAARTNSARIIRLLLSKGGRFGSLVADGDLTGVLERGLRCGFVAAVEVMLECLFERDARAASKLVNERLVPSGASVEMVLDRIRAGEVSSSSRIARLPAVQLLAEFQRAGVDGLNAAMDRLAPDAPALLKFVVANAALVAPPDRPGGASILLRLGIESAAGTLVLADAWKHAIDVIYSMEGPEVRTSIVNSLENEATDADIERLLKNPDFEEIISALLFEDILAPKFFKRVVRRSDDATAPTTRTLLTLLVTLDAGETAYFRADLDRLPEPEGPPGSWPTRMDLFTCSVFIQTIGTCYIFAALSALFMSFDTTVAPHMLDACFTLAHRRTERGTTIPVPVDIRESALKRLVSSDSLHGPFFLLTLCFVRSSLHLQAEMLAFADSIDVPGNSGLVLRRFRSRLFRLTHAFESIMLMSNAMKASWHSKDSSFDLEKGVATSFARDLADAVGVKLHFNHSLDFSVPTSHPVLLGVKYEGGGHALCVIPRAPTGASPVKFYLGDSNKWPGGSDRRFKGMESARDLTQTLGAIGATFETASEVSIESASEEPRDRSRTTAPAWFGESASPFLASVASAAGDDAAARARFLDGTLRLLDTHPTAAELILGEQPADVTQRFRSALRAAAHA